MAFFVSGGLSNVENLTLLSIASSASGYSLVGGDGFNGMDLVDPDNPLLAVFPRFIQSKWRGGFLLLAGACILFSRNVSRIKILFFIPL